MPLEFLISFVLPLQVVFGGAGVGGESGEGRPRKNLRFWRNFDMWENLYTLSAPAPCAIHKACLKAIYLLLIQPGKMGENTILGKKKIKNQQGIFFFFYQGRGKLW